PRGRLVVQITAPHELAEALSVETDLDRPRAEHVGAHGVRRSAARIRARTRERALQSLDELGGAGQFADPRVLSQRVPQEGVAQYQIYLVLVELHPEVLLGQGIH